MSAERPFVPARRLFPVEQRPVGPRVAVAEDDPDMRALVADALRLDGYDVLELSNGADLLVRVARQYHTVDHAEPLDLIVTDIRMPVVTGLAILRGLRRANCATPLILMTSFGDSATREEAAALDAVLLDKPLQLAALRAVARRLVRACPSAH